MTTSETCAHELCRCARPYSAQTQASATARIDPNGEFCSRRCAEQAGGALGDDGCECGHVDCQKKMDAGLPPMQ
jgi:hypothetical protein